MLNKKDIWIITPAYNEEKTISSLLGKIKKTRLNIVVVNDGSSDLTKNIVEKFPVYLLNHKTNLGKGAAMKTGADFAFSYGAQAVIFLDADGQHDPNNIIDYVRKLQQGSEIVFGKRNLGKGTPVIRLLGNKIASRLISLLCGIYLKDLLCGFIGMIRKAYEIVQWDSTGYGVETEIVARTGRNKLKYSEVSIETIYNDKYKGVTVLDALGILISLPSLIINKK